MLSEIIPWNTKTHKRKRRNLIGKFEGKCRYYMEIHNEIFQTLTKQLCNFAGFLVLKYITFLLLSTITRNYYNFIYLFIYNIFLF